MIENTNIETNQIGDGEVLREKTRPARRGGVRPREAEQIITALEAGVVPQQGIQHLLVGRSHEVEEVIRVLERVQSGESDLRVWAGDFGSGKSFMLRTIENLAVQKNFVCSTVDLTPSRRFYATDGKASALYTEIVNRLVVKGASEQQALQRILEQWVYQLIQEVKEQSDLSEDQLMRREGRKLVERNILDTMRSFYSTGLSYELGQAIVCYFRGYAEDDPSLQMQALRWIRGDITTKTEAKRELGIAQIITDDNWMDVLKNLAELFIKIGYAGFVVNFDEVVNVYKLPRQQTRDHNYERVLNLYNECKTGMAKGLFVNLGTTMKTVFDERRGMASYGALKGRMGIDDPHLSKLVDATATVQILRPLTSEEIYTLLEKLQIVYAASRTDAILFTPPEIKDYMEAQLNRPGAAEFLTPRAVIKDFLQILSLARQNRDQSIHDLLRLKFGAGLQVSKDADDHDDDLEIEIL